MPAPHSPQAISAIGYPLALWRYLLLFQSWSQFSSWLCIVLACALPMHLLLVGLEGEAPLEALLCGVALGSLGSVLMVLPVRFCVAPAGEGSMRILLDTLACLGYVQERRTGTGGVYRQKLPRLLRWDEGDIRIAQLRGEIVVSGPRCIVGRMRNAVLKAAREDRVGNIAN